MAKRGLYPETQVQVAVVKWFKLQFPKYSGCILKFDNEGQRSKTGHILSHRMGLRPGVSDLFIMCPVDDYHGCFLEIKPNAFKVNATNKEHYIRQMLFIEDARKQGYAASMECGSENCIEFLRHYMRGDLATYVYTHSLSIKS